MRLDKLVIKLLYYFDMDELAREYGRRAHDRRLTRFVMRNPYRIRL